MSFFFFIIFTKQTSEAPSYTGSLPCQGVELSFATLQICKTKGYPGASKRRTPLDHLLLFMELLRIMFFSE